MDCFHLLQYKLQRKWLLWKPWWASQVCSEPEILTKWATGSLLFIVPVTQQCDVKLSYIQLMQLNVSTTCQFLSTTASINLTSWKFHTSKPKKDIAPALNSSLDNTRSRLLSHATQDLGQRTHTVARYNKHHRAPRSTHGHLDDIEHLPHKDATSPNQWVRGP